MKKDIFFITCQKNHKNLSIQKIFQVTKSLDKAHQAIIINGESKTEIIFKIPLKVSTNVDFISQAIQKDQNNTTNNNIYITYLTKNFIDKLL